MPSNEQRRAAAKRKLERQLERRAQRARRRRQLTIGASVLGVVLVVAIGAVVYSLTSGSTADTTAAGLNEPGRLPAGRAEPLPETVNCTYTPNGSPAKPVEPPRSEGIRTAGEGSTDISVSMETTQGNIGLILHNSESPCTVNNFLSLASKDYYNNTPCHRLTTAPSLSVLQCGDPGGTGTGGPGYVFADEFPADQYAAGDPAASQPVTYPRGTLAMANAGPGTNGSQFFLVYQDAQLPPQYTVFGTIDETGLQTIDKVAAAGVEGGGQDGKPALPISLTTVRMD